MTTSDYILKIRVKNGPLLRAIRAAGFPTIAALSRACGVSQSEIGKFLGLKLAPQRENGEWRTNFLIIANTVRLLPEDLCPPQHLRDPLTTNSCEVDASLDDIAAYLPSSADPQAILEHKQEMDDLQAKISYLNPRMQTAINNRFGLVDGTVQPLKDLGEALGVSVERARQIEFNALRKLRQMYKRVS